MTERELKKEKEELRTILFNKIEGIKGNRELKKVAQKVDELNEFLDGDDTRIENLLDDLSLLFSISEKSKIKKKINDILDNYDKINKSGIPKYDTNKKEKIKTLILDIDEICNRNFLDRFKEILGIGS